MTNDEIRSLEAQADAYQAQADQDRADAPFRRIKELEKKLAAVSRVMCGNDTFPGDLAQYVANEVDHRKAVEQEMEDGDYWQERAKMFMENGGCPVCFASDEAGHEDGCPYGQAESRALAAETLAERRKVYIEHLEDCWTCKEESDAGDCDDGKRLRAALAEQPAAAGKCECGFRKERPGGYAVDANGDCKRCGKPAKGGGE